MDVLLMQLPLHLYSVVLLTIMKTTASLNNLLTLPEFVYRDIAIIDADVFVADSHKGMTTFNAILVTV